MAVGTLVGRGGTWELCNMTIRTKGPLVTQDCIAEYPATQDCICAYVLNMPFSNVINGHLFCHCPFSISDLNPYVESVRIKYYDVTTDTNSIKWSF